MKAPIYIYLSKDKRTSYKSSFKVRASSLRSSASAEEIELKLNIDVPDTLFEKPDIEANIEVAADSLVIPTIKVKANAVGEWLTKK